MLASSARTAEPGTRLVSLLNYTDCIELSNDATVVVLGHQAGGRVLKYEWSGEGALYLDPAESQWKQGTASNQVPMSAGRFDIGPEYLVPARANLWSGEWKAEITGPRAARLISQEDPATGVQLIREFRLDEESSHLECRQVIQNTSNETQRWSHWGRTFAQHGGVVIVPLTPNVSRFPKGYILYQEHGLINFQPEDPHVKRMDDLLVIDGPPAYPKLGFDSNAGWMAYHMRNDRLFVKSYAVHPDRAYGELAAINLSIWYPAAERTPACELEPIGPRNEIPPGASSSFTEHWWLLPYLFPSKPEQFNPQMISAVVRGMLERTPR